MAEHQRSLDFVRQERTGWRDEAISRRHREWGFNCPAVDLDFLMVEYNIGKPVAVVEYKHHFAREPNLLHPTYRAIRELADLANLPFVLAFYWPEIWAFQTTPVNDIACNAFGPGAVYTERQFVTTLYRLRRLKLAEHISSKLHDDLPIIEAA